MGATCVKRVHYFINHQATRLYLLDLSETRDNAYRKENKVKRLVDEQRLVEPIWLTADAGMLKLQLPGLDLV